MTQHTDIVLPLTSYNRADYTALRAYCLKIPVTKIASLYYSEESPQVTGGLERFLIAMRADLVERSIANNPALAASLQHARQGGAVTTRALEILVKAADAPKPVPQPTHRIAQWFRPKTVSAFRSEGLHTLQDLIGLMVQRGATWWRGVPRIGKQRARVIETWIDQHSQSLGLLELVDKTALPYPAVQRVVVSDGAPIPFVPIEQLTIPAHLDGSRGANRAALFCYIAARTDQQAIQAFLSRHAGRTESYRAYYKELQRFFYFALLVARKPLSSFLVDDCVAYVAFIKNPPASFRGHPRALDSGVWKPFSTKGLSESSQLQALRMCRAMFEFWVGVRYLAGNPWIAVTLPKPVKPVYAMQIEKALPETLWKKFVVALASQACQVENAQYRVALAAILLMGDAGCRRNEVVTAMKSNLKASRHASNVHQLLLHGKGNKDRIVAISDRTLAALRAHWEDRGLSENASSDFPLLAPIIPLAIHPSKKKPADQTHYVGYVPAALYRVVKVAIAHILNDPSAEFDVDERQHLTTTTAHAFRHTFGSVGVKKGIPVEVMRRLLGHESIATTSIYVQTEEQEMIQRAGLFFDALEAPEPESDPTALPSSE